jgi:agmatinase
VPRASVALIGVPYERTQSFRGGAAGGPRAIRAASHSLETYSPALDADLESVSLADAGDLDVGALPPASMIDAVAAAVAAVGPRTTPFLLGGDHTVSVGAVRALAARHPDLRVVQLDAHTDLRDAYDDDPHSHACAMRRVWEIVGDGRLVQAGIRSGLREEFAFARAHARWAQSALAIPPTVLDDLAAAPLYITLDVDVLDPASAPGTGNPEPGGFSFNEIASALASLRAARVVGLDVVEVSPRFDPSGITAIAAAKLVREMILLFGVK